MYILSFLFLFLCLTAIAIGLKWSKASLFLFEKATRLKSLVIYSILSLFIFFLLSRCSSVDSKKTEEANSSISSKPDTTLLNAAEKYTREGLSLGTDSTAPVEVRKRRIELYTKAIQTYPTFELAYLARARDYRMFRFYDSALKDINVAINILRMEKRTSNYGYDWFYSERAVIYLSTGNNNDFFRDIDTAILFSPEVKYYNLRGSVYLSMDSIFQAKTEFEKALQKDPNNAYALKLKDSCDDIIDAAIMYDMKEADKMMDKQAIKMMAEEEKNDGD